VRRIVTGHDAGGRSVVLSDGPPPMRHTIERDGVSFDEIWCTSATPAPVGPGDEEPTLGALRVPPDPGGTRIRVNTFAPGHLDERGLQSPIHRTESVDYGIVLDGEITLVLDEQEVVLRAGDIVVQRGTDHAWANRSNAPARVAFVLVDGRFTDELRSRLPAGALELLMHDGPDEGH
jgi:mannose-6-phosphate isomerase-like protein (cupin superfamily)